MESSKKYYRGRKNGTAVVAVVFIFFLAALLVPAYLFADTGPHEGGGGCAPGTEEISCSTSYGEGCEQYRDSPDYYVGRWEIRGVQTDYKFCKGTQPAVDVDPWLPVKVGTLVLVAVVSFLLLRKMHQKK
ncbi:MAG: hypothetical protein Q8P56_05470 [Candidatus Uhrbacteria bacterium]|nr:hypothetical protein [Candidatus Uhrbacteria bacterium]